MFFEQVCGLGVCGFCIRFTRGLRSCKFPRTGRKNLDQSPTIKTNARQFLGQMSSTRWMYSDTWVHSYFMPTPETSLRRICCFGYVKWVRSSHSSMFAWKDVLEASRKAFWSLQEAFWRSLEDLFKAFWTSWGLLDGSWEASWARKRFLMILNRFLKGFGILLGVQNRSQIDHFSNIFPDKIFHCFLWILEWFWKGFGSQNRWTNRSR